MSRFTIATAALALLLGNPALGAEPHRWTPQEWEKARAFSFLAPPPKDATNRLSGNESAARLGRRLFFDRRLSPRRIACTSCHQPERGFADGLPVAHTIAPIHRNTPTVLNAVYFRWFNWDGSRDSLWHQATGPLESAKETGSSRLYVVRAATRHYRMEMARLIPFPRGWERIWRKLPERGKPGEPSFDRLPAAWKKMVNRVFSNTTKIIAAYEERLVSNRAPFDRYVAGDRGALSKSARRGFRAFLRLNCDFCHNGALFSDDSFHNIGMPPLPKKKDLGRWDGLATLKRSIFRGTGPFSDGEPIVIGEEYRRSKTLQGRFRTPSLRELKRTAPYGHNGTLQSLEAVINHYVRVTNEPSRNFPGKLDPSLFPIKVREGEKKDLVAFLLSLSSDYRSRWTRPPAIRK